MRILGALVLGLIVVGVLVDMAWDRHQVAQDSWADRTAEYVGTAPLTEHLELITYTVPSPLMNNNPEFDITCQVVRDTTTGQLSDHACRDNLEIPAGPDQAPYEARLFR